jgi:hypothetical protein
MQIMRTCKKAQAKSHSLLPSTLTSLTGPSCGDVPLSEQRRLSHGGALKASCPCAGSVCAGAPGAAAAAGSTRRQGQTGDKGVHRALWET